jgi:hypothetical protein
MVVAPEKIEANKCYRTSTGEVRRVTDISDDQVTFEVRGKRHRRYPWDRRPRQSRQTFASVVIEEVPSQWDPDVGDNKT